MTFAEHLRRLRVDHFLSQRDLARLAGLHAMTLVRLEAGATAPSSRTVRALAAALGVEPRELDEPGGGRRNAPRGEEQRAVASPRHILTGTSSWTARGQAARPASTSRLASQLRLR